MLQPQAFSSVALFIHLTIFLLVSFASSKPDGVSLELIHIDSPESPFYPGKLPNSERISRLVELSTIRAESLASGLTSNSSFSPAEALRPGVSVAGLHYVVKVLVGTPGVPLFLVLDSGSHMFWTQCEPCTHRFHQQPPVFTSTASHSFRELNCQNPFCRNNPDYFQCANDKCVYTRTYGDGSQTSGIAAQDMLQSTNSDRIPILFGCSRDNRNFPAFEPTGKVGGIIGLSMSQISVLQQLSHITQRRFSYCLNPLENNPSTATTFLRFGNDIRTRGRRFLSTPFVSPPNKPLYYLNLLDISVGAHRLHIPGGTFALRPDGTGGTIIDSGTTISFISQPAFVPVVNVFKDYFDHHGFHSIHIPHIQFDVCYTKGRSNYTVHDFPSMTYHFQGADFVVRPEYVYVKINHRTFCLVLKPIAPNRPSMIGTVNQANTRFIYDAASRQLLFTSEDCHRDM